MLIKSKTQVKEKEQLKNVKNSLKEMLKLKGKPYKSLQNGI